MATRTQSTNTIRRRTMMSINRQSAKRRRLQTKDLPPEPGAVGIYSPFGFLWGCLFAIVPVAYVYIVFILLRELSVLWPAFATFVETYVPLLASLLLKMQQKTPSSTLVELWCILEAMFYVWLKCHIRYLEHRDPLEQSLSSAPFMTLDERALLWKRMMILERDDPASLITGWFFDQPLENISRYDVREFVTWCMFEGRNQEHLTSTELEQLDDFVRQLEYHISIQYYGIQSEGEDEGSVGSSHQTEQVEIIDGGNTTADATAEEKLQLTARGLPQPKEWYHFAEVESHSSDNFFSDLYESYSKSYEKYRAQLAERSPDFHPVEDLKHFMATTTQQILDAEEQARAAATSRAGHAMTTATETATHAINTATSTATHMYESILQPVGQTLTQQLPNELTSFGHATRRQLIDAFHSVKQNMKERLETAKVLSSQRKALNRQLEGYREMLHRLRDMSSEVPSQQMAALMRRITESNLALERLEHGARDAFAQATGYARKNLRSLNPQQEPQPYAKYSSDPLLGVATFPLGFHLLILGATEIPLRIMMSRRGFERKTIGSIAYYYHPGEIHDDDEDEHGHHYNTTRFDDKFKGSKEGSTPIVFVHGIGIGLISYVPLIDHMLALGRPLFLPEISYVSGFRPWQGPNSVLPPAVVCSTLTAMMATHGFLQGTFAGHSYGTSWLSYMCKYQSSAVSALLFLDPICFCLHTPRLTKKFVYHQPDIGVISYIVRTDLIVNWTIQRSFPWAWIILFTEQIHVPCSVFLSDKDALVPAEAVESYLRSKGARIKDFHTELSENGLQQPTISPETSMTNTHDMDTGSSATSCASDGSCSIENEERIHCVVFRGHGHGDWTDYPEHTVPVIADHLKLLCDKAETRQSQ